MFGPCKLCSEKDLRIAAMQQQIDTLTRLVFPTTEKHASLRDREADRILNGDQDIIELTEDEVASEAASIVTGSYESSQVEIE